MTNLGIAGAVSLNSVNQWISTINTNLNNSKRIGYKETKLSFTSGEVSSTGTTQGVGKTVNVTFPSASLEVAKTQILDYVQGNLTPTGVITDFALNGMGYFVVEDKFGEKYATRDGQFNFDTDGYLVTAEGLRVLTTGLDYIRVPASEHFSVNGEGESQSTTTDPSTFNAVFNPAANVSSLSQSIYGTKKLLVIDIPTESKLMYSKYGFTKFQLGNTIPIVIQNDFSEVTDGINTALMPDSLLNAGVPPAPLPPAGAKMADYFKHDLKNGTIKMSGHDVTGVPNNRYVQALVSAQRFGDFNASVDFHARDLTGIPLPGVTGETPFGLTIGKRDITTTDNSGAYFVGVVGGNLQILRNGSVLSTAPLTGTLPTDGWYDTSLDPTKKYTLKVDAINGLITGQVFLNGTAVSGIVSIPSNEYKDGYISIGNSANIPTPGNGGPQDDIIEITNLSVVQRNKDSEYTTGIIQKNIKDDKKNGINDKYQNETRVVQQSVEESTATIADTLPMLSAAQKLFSAVSKIISVYNTMTDDVNGILR